MSGFWYVSTPYRLYHLGKEEAFNEAKRITRALQDAGIPVYSPIVHAHALRGPLADDNRWLEQERPLMRKAGGLIIAKMDGWIQSEGVTAELDFFRRSFKPVVDLDPDDIGFIIPALKATHLS